MYICIYVGEHTHIYVYIYIHGTPPKNYLFNPIYRYVSGMFVESQVSRFKSDKWRFLSFSSLTSSSSWIQDPRFPRGLGSVDPRFFEEEFLGILDLGSWLAGPKISQEEFLGILDLGS